MIIPGEVDSLKLEISRLKASATNAEKQKEPPKENVPTIIEEPVEPLKPTPNPAVKKKGKKKSPIAMILGIVAAITAAFAILVFTGAVDLNTRSLSIPNVNIGDTILFGAYEQDNKIGNGKEPIEWIVLDKQGSRVLVISKYALDCKQYNTSLEDVT